MNIPNEALFRWNTSGTFSGGHTIAYNTVTGQLTDPLPLGVASGFPYSEVAAEINTASLATIAARDATITALQSQLTALQAQYDAYVAAHP